MLRVILGPAKMIGSLAGIPVSRAEEIIYHSIGIARR